MKKKKENVKDKNIKLISIVAVIAVVVVTVIIAVVIGLNLNQTEQIPDNYFVSDNTKLVMSLDDETTAFQDGEFEPSLTHIVYYYSGDKIENVKIFFVYGDEEEAKAAYDGIGDDYKEWAKNKKLNGKYIIFQADDSFYNGLDVEQIRENIESAKAVGGAV